MLISVAQQQYNASMTTVRVAVEWVLGDILAYFALMDYKKDLRIGLSPVGKMYMISALLTNALTSLCNKQRSPDCALFCCKARKKRLEHERSVGGNARRSRELLPTS